MATVSIAHKSAQQEQQNALTRLVRDNGLSLALFGIFLVTIVGQASTGLAEYNQQQEEHNEPTLGLVPYLMSGHFVEAVFENWESEFLQMAGYVFLTVWLRQKGSSESKKLDGEEAVDADPRLDRTKPNVPWPLRAGGIWLRLYENSLALAFLLLFGLSFTFHAVGGAMQYNEEQQAHGETSQVSVVGYIATPRFWFESFQNWQSEFLSLGVMVVLSIFLRQRGSPESKPVAAPHAQTGSD
jgi:hypothetical protein